MSEANLSYEAKPSAINLPNLNINSYPKNMSPCNDFITYFFVDEMDIFTRLSRASIATYAIRLFTAWVINQSERGKSIKYVIIFMIAKDWLYFNPYLVIVKRIVELVLLVQLQAGNYLPLFLPTLLSRIHHTCL